MKKNFFIFSVILTFALGLIANLHAFCVHNNTNITIVAEEIQGGFGLARFKKTIKPHQTKCCNWKNRGCNLEGKKSSPVEFNIYRHDNGKHICYPETSADGDIYINKDDGNFKCIGVDGGPY